MRRTKTEKIDILVNKIIEGYAKKGDNYQHLIFSEWKQMLGVTVTNATKKMYLKERKLFVYLDSPIIKQELIYLKEKLIEHFNKKYPQAQLEDIIFK